MEFEQTVCELLALLVADLVEQRPDDPLEHMLGMLTFPFSTTTSTHLLNPNLCSECNDGKGTQEILKHLSCGSSSCCVYELRDPFCESGDKLMVRMTEFLNSKQTIMVIVGDGEYDVSTNSLCDCFGSGKSRLCRWLDVPGKFIHRRRVVRIDSSSVSSLITLLESMDKRNFTNKLSELSEETLVPTLSLIDHIEPPHHVLHALLQHNYFRAERHLTCLSCTAPTNSAVHKTILFTRPGVFFKFPVPCSIFSLVRVKKSAQMDDKPHVASSSISYTALIGPAHSNKGRVKRVGFDESTPVRQETVPLSSAHVIQFKEKAVTTTHLRSIFEELSRHCARRPCDLRQASTNLDASATFCASIQSRCRTEFQLSKLIIDELLAMPFDVSSFPELLTFMVNLPLADVYFAECLQRVLSRKIISRLQVGNLLCIAAVSQQTLSSFALAATATEMLQMYLDFGTSQPVAASETEDASSLADSSATLGASLEALERMNLQNIVVESVEYSKRGLPMVAQSLLDVRGALVDYELLSYLVKGTTVRSFFRHRSSSPGSSSAGSADGLDLSFERQMSRAQSDVNDARRGYGHPVLLLSDVTDVGRHGFDGQSVPQRTSKIGGTNPLHCFLITLEEVGVSLVVSVEKHRVIARSTFARADTDEDTDEQLYWQVVFANSRSVVDISCRRDSSVLTTPVPETETLTLQLADGSACCLNLYEIRCGMMISVTSAGVNDNARTKFVAPPQKPPPHVRSRSHPTESGLTEVPAGLGTQKVSFERYDSRITVELADEGDGSEAIVALCDRCIKFLDRRTLECEDPKAITSSSSWIAAVSHDSDIVCAVANPFSGSNNNPVIMQTEFNIVCLCILGDQLLVAGLESGCVQGFDLVNGSETFVIEHHEAQVNVVRSLTIDSSRGASSHLFIVGSDDSTMTIFCAGESDPVRSLRYHSAPVIDIVATHALRHSIVISGDRNGSVIVWTLELEWPTKPGTVLWSSTFLGLRTLSLSCDASWLVCSRVQNTPVALPISEWTRQGTGRFHQRPITALHITRDEKYLLTGGDDGLIFVWDMNNSVQYLCSFQQHSTNCCINEISTSSDNSKVVSSDATNLICLWKLQTGTIIRILQRTPGGGFARFIVNDFLLVQTCRGVKVFDNEERLFASSTQTDVGCLDVYFVPDDIYSECFERKAAAIQQRKVQRICNTSSNSDSSSAAASLNDSAQAGAGNEQLADPNAMSCNLEYDRIRRQCFIGVAKGNADSGLHYVSIASLQDLDSPVFELIRGEVEDEFGDEEELSHTDRITAFTFLAPRPPYVKSSDADAAPPPPTILLAATGAEDLTVIIWNWLKQEPLKLLQHTSFVTSCLFWYPSLGPRASYGAEHLQFMSKVDPSFSQCRDGAVVCNLITSQYADSTNRVSLRVFQVRENNRAFQKRLLGLRCNQVTTAATFPYNMITVDEVSTCPIPVPSGELSSVKCIVIRASDGLVCTGDETCQVIFWRLCASRTTRLAEVFSKAKTSRESDDDDDAVKPNFGTGSGMQLRPLRRIVSRI